MEFVQGNIFIREMRFERAGQVVNGHAHNFDHTTYVTHGAIRIEQLRVLKEAVFESREVLVAPELRALAAYNDAHILEEDFLPRQEVTDVVLADETFRVALAAAEVSPVYHSMQVMVSPMESEVVRSVEKRASDGYNFVLIRAGVVHRLTALEDNSLGHCIYAHRNNQGEVVQENDGWAPAYL